MVNYIYEKGGEHMENESREYVTFKILTKEGKEVEMAVVEEFDFEKKHYVVGAVVENDEIIDDGRYIYRCKMVGNDFEVEKITKQFEYKQVVEAYMNMEE